jgi:hypothetical protein
MLGLFMKRGCGFLSLFLCGAAFAESSPGQYVPKTGDALDYNKKFYPEEESRDWFVELNPLLLLTRTLVVESERRISDGYTLGLDLRYRNASVYSSNGVKGTLTYFGVAPKFRLYPLPTLSGVFFGFKVLLGSAQAEIVGTETKSWDQFIVAPVAHVGYRITSRMGVTLALYLGGGVNIPQLEIKESEFPAAVTGSVAETENWRDAASALKQAESRFKPDFGLSLGVAF